MIKRIGHIGIAVKNLDETLAVVSKSLGVPIPPIKDIPDRNLRVALIDLGGVGLEFIQDNRKDGDLAKFVNQKGNGIHHLCLLTNDIETDLEVLKKRGVEMVDQKPRLGIRGKRIVFTRESALNGVPFELSEP